MLALVDDRGRCAAAAAAATLRILDCKGMCGRMPYPTLDMIVDTTVQDLVMIAQCNP
jgi:hypothetical protein